MNVVVLGRPGAGKGTQSKRIASHFGLRHLSTGELLRSAKRQDTPVGRRIAQRIDAGEFVEDELAMSLVEEAMRPTTRLGYVFDGIPRTVRQGQLLAELLQLLGTKIDFVILLDVNEGAAQTRLLERAKVEGRSDDTAETIQRRFAVYEAETAPLVNHYRPSIAFRSIDGSRAAGEVFELVLEALEGTATGAPGEMPVDS